MVVEEESEITTAVETTPASKDDGSQLPSLIKQQKEARDLVPDEFSCDKAYSGSANLETLDNEQITGYMSIKEKYNPNQANIPHFRTIHLFLVSFEGSRSIVLLG